MRIQTNTPHIEPAWSEAFLLELRLRGVAGIQIGAALAEVEAHCADSGETAHAAFGDARSYATALELPPSPDHSVLDELPSVGLGLGGMLLTLAAVGAWRSASEVNVTGGSVAVLVILLGGIALIFRYAAPLVRAIATSTWLAIAFAVAPVAVFVCALLVFGKTVLLTLPMAPSLVVGLLALAASTLLALRRVGSCEDPVVGPPQTDGVGTLKMSSTLDRVGARLTPWLFLLLTAVMCLPLLLF